MADKSDIGKVGKPITIRIEAGKIREFTHRRHQGHRCL